MATRRNDRWLLISDLQIPFHLAGSDPTDDALKFCKKLQKDYKIPHENILNLGDETDQYFGGQWKKSPEASHTPNSEIRECIKILGEWYRAFPQMKLCTSNHGTRWMRKAAEAEIPSVMMRKYRDVILAPVGWQWKKRWIINAKHRFAIEHGDDWGGQRPHIEAALHLGMSVALGHHHALFQAAHLNTATQCIWGAVLGSLIDFEQYAFEYARRAKLKPFIGCGVVVDDGKKIILEPC